MNKTGFSALFKIFFLALILQTSSVFSQENQPDGNTDVESPEINAQNENTSENTSGENAENAEKKEEAAKKPVLVTNPGMQKLVNEQYRSTPEDPSFLYETRFIPGNKIKEEFLPVELEKEVIKERIEEEKNFKKSLEKIQIRLPDLKQTLIIAGLIIIILVYRARARRQSAK